MPANIAELGVLRIAKPCHRDWDKMTGDERTRFCADCKLNVYDLSTMTTEEARALIREKEGDLCVRFFQRPDGTVLTKDCPVGVARRKRSVVAAAAGAALAAIGGTTAYALTIDEPVPLMAEPIEGSGCATTAPTAAEAHAQPEEDGWMEKRRKQLGAREKSSAGYHTMGAIRLVSPVAPTGGK